MIDVVIAWVDGDDPSHKAKRRMYMPSEMSQSDDIGGSTRFASRGEILFCVGSVLRFAPFVHKVYIVTDSQRPDLDAFLHKNFPDNRIPIEISAHVQQPVHRDHALSCAGTGGTVRLFQ